MSTVIATSKNAVLVFIPKIDPVNSITLQGFSDEHIMAIQDKEQFKSEVGCDGTVQLSGIAEQLEGDFTFFPQSATLLELQALLTAANLIGVPLVGVLNVSLPAMNRKYIYNNFAFLSGVIGIPLEKTAKPVTIKWRSDFAIPI